MGSCVQAVTSTLSLKALAWSKAACPMLPSMTKMTSVGFTDAATCSRAPSVTAAHRAASISHDQFILSLNTYLAHFLEQFLLLFVPTTGIYDDQVLLLGPELFYTMLRDGSWVCL